MARSEVLAFLADIKEHPLDRTPRLILADWLEERDDPRGSLLRAQVEATSLVPNSLRRLELAEQERRLLAAHQDRWLGCLKPHLVSFAFQRGLVQIQSAPDKLVREQSAAVIDSEELAWVETIRLYGDTAQPRDYSETRSLQGARVLDGSWARLQSAHLEGLSEAAAFPFMGELILNTCNLGPAGLGALSVSRSFPLLRDLRLTSCGINEEGVASLMRGRLIGQLHSLDLRNNRIGRSGVGMLAFADDRSNLRELNLMANQLGDDVIPHLLASPCFEQLHVLDLRSNPLTNSPRVNDLSARFGPRVRLGT